MSTSHRNHLLALATAVVSISAAIKSIRSPGSEGFASAQHAEDLVQGVIDVLSNEEVADLQADARTSATVNPGTVEPHALNTTGNTEPSAEPVPEKPTTATEAKDNAAKEGVAVAKAPDAEPAKTPNATGATGMKTAG